MSSNPFVCANRHDVDGRRDLLVVRSIADTCKAMTPRTNRDDDGSFHIGTHQVVCILLYDGDGANVIINYVLLILNLAVCVAQLGSVAKRRSHGVNQRLVPQQLHRWTRRRAVVKACVALVLVVAFQIGLCLAVGCVGISIVWCAMMGWLASERICGGVRRRVQADRLRSETVPLDAASPPSPSSLPAETDAYATNYGPETDGASPNHLARAMEERNLDFLVMGAAVLDVSAILHYWAVLPAITTVAHICAIVLGSLCWWVGALVN